MAVMVEVPTNGGRQEVVIASAYLPEDGVGLPQEEIHSY